MRQLLTSSCSGMRLEGSGGHTSCKSVVIAEKGNIVYSMYEVKVVELVYGLFSNRPECGLKRGLVLDKG